MTENSQADNHLWDEYRTTLYRFILTRVNDPAIAEDIVQEVLIKVYERLNTLKDQEKILSWMYQITRNTIVDYYRQHRPTEDIAQTMAAKETNTEEDVEKELSQCILPMVNQLPADYREAIQMAEFNRLTQKEIAQKQGLSLSGAKSRVQRGRKLLKEKLLDCCRIELDRQGKVYNYECKNC
jgi:RNA polymerase sigma-70 factor (ECF subfamily)